MRNNKRIYQKIMRNISKQIKHILDENIQNFDITDYSDDETDIIDRHELNKYVYKYFPKNKAELKSIIEQRIEENHECPYLLDICTTDIIDMSRLFEDCNTIKKLDLDTWDTSNVVNMGAMFVNCTFLKEIKMNKNGFNTSNVITMNSMFFGCKSLESLNLSSWDVSKCENMTGLFNNCESLKELDLSSWDVSNVKYIGIIFARCLRLQTLDLSGWDISSAFNTYGMFIDTNSLKLVYTSDEKIIDYLEFHHHNSFCGLTIINKELNEDVQNFDITDYREDNDTLIDQDTVTKMTCYPFTVCFKAYRNITIEAPTDTDCIKEQILRLFKFNPEGIHVYYNPNYSSFNNYYIHIYKIRIYNQNMLKDFLRLMENFSFCIQGSTRVFTSILAEDDGYNDSIEEYLRSEKGGTPDSEIDKFIEAVENSGITIEDCIKDKR